MNQEQVSAAKQELASWLECLRSFGRIPSVIECVGTFELDGLLYYKMIFKGGFFERKVFDFAGGIFSFLGSFASFLDNVIPAAGPWLFGIVGGYKGDSPENNGIVFSWMEEYNESKSDEIAINMVKTFIENSLKNRGVTSNEPYNEKERETIMRHIETYCGKPTAVIPDSNEEDYGVKIYIVPPEGDRDYYTLATSGIGAFSVKTPLGVNRYANSRVELMIALPDYWKLDNESLKEGRWEWPVKVIRTMVKCIVEDSSWVHLGYGGYFGKLDESTDLSYIITMAGILPEGGDVCKLPTETPVNFFHIIPLYQSEADFYNNHTLEELLDKMGDVSFVVDPNRPSAV